MAIQKSKPTGRMCRKERGTKRKQGILRDIGRRPVKERSEQINKREEVGHWESDSIVSSKSRTILNVIVERKSRYVQITKLEDATAQKPHQALCERLMNYGPNRVKSITFDNGTKNANYKELEMCLSPGGYE